MRNTFFENIALSDSEKVHSSILCWIINQNSDLFPKEEKTKFIKSLFKLPENKNIGEFIQIVAEFKKMDIFIETENTIFIIENKLKSSEHSNQTILYEEIFESNHEYKNKLKHYGFLSLTNEMPQNQNWILISYELLFEKLNSVKWNDKNRNFIFVNEYLNTLSNLVKVYNEFCINHKIFSNVFLDGSKKKEDKTPFSDESKDYIRKNQLETIFQKLFLHKIAHKAKIKDYKVNETRGVASLQKDLDFFLVNGVEFKVGFQFQGKTLKINYSAVNYKNSNLRDLHEKIIIEFEAVYKDEKYKRLNKGRKKAYISVSRKLERELYQYNIKELSKIMKDEIEYIKSKIELFKKRIS